MFYCAGRRFCAGGARSAYFLQAFVNIGLVPDGGASWMLPRMVGKARATEMMMLGEKIGAEQAADWGMIYKCVEDDALATEAQALATRLANGPTAAYATMRKNILTSRWKTVIPNNCTPRPKGSVLPVPTPMRGKVDLAFLQKRKAEFTGK